VATLTISVDRVQNGTPGRVGFAGTQSLVVAPGAMVQVQGTEGGLDRYASVPYRDLAALRLIVSPDPAELSVVEIVKRDESRLSVPVRIDEGSFCAIEAYVIEGGGGRSAVPVRASLAGASAVEARFS
jgi:hypothetical protein